MLVAFIQSSILLLPASIRQGDPFQLLSWLLNTLDAKLQRHDLKIVAKTFQVGVQGQHRWFLAQSTTFSLSSGHHPRRQPQAAAHQGSAGSLWHPRRPQLGGVAG